MFARRVVLPAAGRNQLISVGEHVGVGAKPTQPEPAPQVGVVVPPRLLTRMNELRNDVRLQLRAPVMPMTDEQRPAVVQLGLLVALPAVQAADERLKPRPVVRVPGDE
ncbi:MAG: hypothetical protein QM754_00425 [Tepidisphaeraceae bacterium]